MMQGFKQLEMRGIQGWGLGLFYRETTCPGFDPTAGLDFESRKKVGCLKSGIWVRACL